MVQLSSLTGESILSSIMKVSVWMLMEGEECRIPASSSQLSIPKGAESETTEFSLSCPSKLIRIHCQLRIPIIIYAYIQLYNQYRKIYTKMVATWIVYQLLNTSQDVISNPVLKSARQEKLFTIFRCRNWGSVTVWHFWVIVKWSQHDLNPCLSVFRIHICMHMWL